MRSTLSAAAAVFAPLLFFAGGDSAACSPGLVTTDVESTADVSKLTRVLNCTGPGVFLVTWHQTVLINSRVEVHDGKHLTVIGSSTNASVQGRAYPDATIDAGSTTGVFSVSNGSKLTLRHLVVTAGMSDGGGAVTAKTASIVNATDCVFARNNASSGGAILLASDSELFLAGNVTFIDNAADTGGAIHLTNSRINANDSITFISNTAGSSGGAMRIGGSTLRFGGDISFAHNSASTGGAIQGSNTNVTFGGIVHFSSNSATSTGGAMRTEDSRLSFGGGTSFRNNSASTGGAMSINGGSNHFNSMTTFGDNYADNGGAIRATETSFTFEGTVSFINNSATTGGAMHVDSGEVWFESETTFSGNSANTGGAMRMDASYITLGGYASFTNNSATTGGAMRIDGGDNHFISTTTFGDNSATNAGAIRATKTYLTFEGTVDFARNSAISTGGAILADSSNISFESETAFSGNSATTGGAVRADDTSITFDGPTTFVENTARWGGALRVDLCTISLGGFAAFSSNNATIGGALRADDCEIYSSGSSVTEFTTNTAENGGAIRADSSTITFEGNTTFTNHVAEIGGAIRVNRSQVNFDGTAVFIDNRADYGGAIRVDYSSMTLTGKALFVNNSAKFNGGAIHDLVSTTRIGGSTTFSSNTAQSGGAVFASAASNITLFDDVLFEGNTASAGGGSLSITAPVAFDVRGTTFKGNHAQFGGAIAMTSTETAEHVLNNCTFQANIATTDGGALYLYTSAGQERIHKSTFRRNFAGFSGGAITHTGSMTMVDSTFESNRAGKEGLAIMSIGLLGEVSNVTFANNTWYCPLGQYGYNEETDQVPNEPSRLESVCGQCWTSEESISDSVNVDNNSTTPVCARLPDGVSASSDGVTLETLHLDEHYSRISLTSHEILECYNGEACKGGTNTDEYCAPGYKGPYCAVCAVGYAPGNNYNCHRCSETLRNSGVGFAAVAITAALLLIAVAVWDIKRAAFAEPEPGTNQTKWQKRMSSCKDVILKVFPLAELKIVLVVWQIITQFSSIAGQVYPDEYADFLSRLNFINLDLGFFVSYSCLMETDFFDRLLLATLAPIVFLGALALVCSAVRTMVSSSRDAMRRVWNIYLSTTLFVMFFVYSSVSFTIFQTFACEILDDGIAYLRADYSVTCSTTQHNRYRLYALVMVCIYPVGIPAVFAWVLAQNRRELVQPNRDTMVHLEPLKGLWSAYHPSKYYFEVVECIRRVSFSGIAVFVLPNSAAQISIELLLAVISTYISETLSPFENVIDMGLYRWGNGIIFASMYVALLLRVDVSQEGTEALSSFVGVLIAANVFMIVTVVVQSILLIVGLHAVVPTATFRLGGFGREMRYFISNLNVWNANRRRACREARTGFREENAV